MNEDPRVGEPRLVDLNFVMKARREKLAASRDVKPEAAVFEFGSVEELSPTSAAEPGAFETETAFATVITDGPDHGGNNVGPKPVGAGLDAGLAELFEEFRAAEEGDDVREDFETHYNMGTAYKEMDLLDEAIQEFQTAAGLVKPALALSLHSTTAALRAQLLPRAPRFAPADLVAAGERYARATGYPIQYQWTLIDGVNDGDDEIEGIVELLRGKYALMNMIPYNTIAGVAFKRPSWERAAQIARTLHRRGVLTKLRQSAGQDVDAGCGQLRARAAGHAVVISISRDAASTATKLPATEPALPVRRRTAPLGGSER